MQNTFAGNLPEYSSAQETDYAKLFPSSFTCAILFPNFLVTTIVKHDPYYGSFEKNDGDPCSSSRGVASPIIPATSGAGPLEAAPDLAEILFLAWFSNVFAFHTIEG